MLDIHEVDGVRQTSLPIAEDNPAVVEAGKVQSKLHKTRGGRKGGNMLQDRNRKGIKINRIFTRGGSNPFDMVEWEKRRASIVGDKGELIFVQDNVEVPKDWSMLATNIVASKYFYGAHGTSEREYSVRQLVHRVVRTITDWGLKDGYFAGVEDAENFYSELAWVCINQYGAFNSPVWFNVGLHHVYGHSSPTRTSYCWSKEQHKVVTVDDAYKYPQASACFIQSVDDTMEDIMRLAASEAIIFKYGSGTGTDLSTLRSSKEKLSGGGSPSGPISFMRVYDQIAAVVKSGGKTRRAAKMQSLKVSHPDIMEFIKCKMEEEKKAAALIREGYDGSFGGEAYSSVMFQNCNLSVRVTDEFMRCVEEDGLWETKAVKTGETVETFKARDIFRAIAEATHYCGDPGLQYDTTINKWNTCANSGRINASNPCSEFMFLDNSACNLASVNLTKFLDESGTFNVEHFAHVVRLFIIAQDILVDNGSYPTPEISLNSHLYRPLGLGYANLGAMLMMLGLPYDSDKGRALASLITALLTGYAYYASIELASALGPFEKYEENRDCMLRVIRMHQHALDNIDRTICVPELLKSAESIWSTVVEEGERTGFRNAQVTLLAPTGTIGFMMDCDTTGIEPDIAIIKYKQLAGGGVLKIVNKSVPLALKRLGYSEEQIEEILKYIDEFETVEGAPHLKQEHLAVFDCAFRPKNGQRYISYRGHLKMMAAVQPFLSGAISKTVNLPNDITVEDIMQIYMDGWKMGLKALALYRDGSKGAQPLLLSKEDTKKGAGASKVVAQARPYRRRMPETRRSITHKFEIAGHEGYLTVGIYEDGTPGELFITMAKEGSTVSGMMDAFGIAISLCLQYGVPLSELCRKFIYSRFEPSGYTKNPRIKMATSIVDYIFRWLQLTFPNGKNEDAITSTVVQTPPREQEKEVDNNSDDEPSTASEFLSEKMESQFSHLLITDDAPPCDVCGAITFRNGSCYRCHNCGNSMGCS
jgi:ribonucleoside-diphosphate reductase alpha chain